jgi:hypothetical protein
VSKNRKSEKLIEPIINPNKINVPILAIFEFMIHL